MAVKSTCIDMGVFDLRKDWFCVGGVRPLAEARMEMEERLPATSHPQDGACRKINCDPPNSITKDET